MALRWLHTASGTLARGQHGQSHHHPQAFKKCQLRVTKPPSPLCMARALGTALQTTTTGLEPARCGNIACLRP